MRGPLKDRPHLTDELGETHFTDPGQRREKGRLGMAKQRSSKGLVELGDRGKRRSNEPHLCSHEFRKGLRADPHGRHRR